MQSRPYDRMFKRLYEIAGARNIDLHHCDAFEEFIIQELARITEQLHGCYFNPYDDNYVYIAATMSADALPQLLALNERFSGLNVTDVTEEVHNDRTSIASSINGYPTVVVKMNCEAVLSLILPLFDKHLADRLEFAKCYQAQSHPFSVVEKAFDETFLPEGIEFKKTHVVEEMICDLVKQSPKRAAIIREALNDSLVPALTSLVNEYAHAMNANQLAKDVKNDWIYHEIWDAFNEASGMHAVVPTIASYAPLESGVLLDARISTAFNTLTPTDCNLTSLDGPKFRQDLKYHAKLYLEVPAVSLLLVWHYIYCLDQHNTQYFLSEKSVGGSNRQLSHSGLLSDMKDALQQQPHKLDQYRKQTGKIKFTALDYVEQLTRVCNKLEKAFTQSSRRLAISIMRLNEQIQQYHLQKKAETEECIQIVQENTKQYANNITEFKLFARSRDQRIAKEVNEIMDGLHQIMRKDIHHPAI